MFRVSRTLPCARTECSWWATRSRTARTCPSCRCSRLFRDYIGITDADSDHAGARRSPGGCCYDESFRELLPVVFEFFGVPDPERRLPRMDPEAKQRAALRDPAQGSVREGNVASQLVTLIEDLHWIDAGSEAFLEQLVDAIAGSRVPAAGQLSSRVPRGVECEDVLPPDAAGATRRRGRARAARRRCSAPTRASTAWQRRFTSAPTAIPSSSRRWSSR